MVDNIQNPKSLFPDLPREIPVIASNGDFSSLWSLSFASLFQALQDNFKNEGIVFPWLSYADIQAIETLYAPYIGMALPSEVADISGQAVFDSDNRVSKQFIITYTVVDGVTVVATAAWRTFQFV